MIEPIGFNLWNKALQGAFRKGYSAFNDGVMESECPYDDKRKDCGRLTWSRSFITAWRDGWVHAACEKKQMLITEYYSDKRKLR